MRDMVAHFKSSIWGDNGRLISRTHRVPGQLGIHSETLSQNKQNQLGVGGARL